MLNFLSINKNSIQVKSTLSDFYFVYVLFHSNLQLKVQFIHSFTCFGTKITTYFVSSKKSPNGQLKLIVLYQSYMLQNVENTKVKYR